MGTRSDITQESFDSDDDFYDISYMFENAESRSDIVHESTENPEDQQPVQHSNILEGYAVIDNDIPSTPTATNEIIQNEKNDLEKYKELAYLYFSKFEDLEKEYKNIQRKQAESNRNAKELAENLDKAKKQRDEAVKEKENMVIKYAVGEKKILAESQSREKAEKKCKELKREKEIQEHKVRTLISEKARICQMFDNKVHEQKALQQEFDRLKSEMSSLENEMKWCQNSLKNEVEAHRDSQKTIENLNRKLADCADQIEQVKKEAQESIKSFKYSEENQAFLLDQKCKEQQASLILLKHERDDRENQVKTLQIALERLQSKHQDMLQENNELSQKVQQLELERLDSRQKLSELRGCADQQLQYAADLQMKTAQLEQYKLQLINEQEQLKACEEQMAILKCRNSDLESDIEACRTREAELLLFTQQLTDKNVRLQSEFTALETRIHQLTSEQTQIKRSTKEHETKAAMLLGQLSEQKQKYLDEIDTLRKSLNEEKVQNAKLKQELYDQKGENAIIKRKHELSLKEVQKELNSCRKSLEEYKNTDRSTSSSRSSLSGGVTEKGNEGYSEDNVKVIQPDGEIDRQILIEHIVKLQRISARKSEKIDFLEEHVNTLIAELQKKSKLLQVYMLREQAGTLTSDKMDNTKADLAKLNGIMASMYSSRVADENLTLELSLDINRKLQAVLEDVLLKNITLKKSVDTLGEEIDRLNKLLKSHNSK
ncbi:coiled-coil domain-containing protein 186-like [Coccinella septempunctata]|uniref:coiled-coil domain-containing protein 186-like n=1 Tax=Coccinella septempunctata TaxID=41139 RepID=UPI001D060953|nr:coiled-coil domain-containing protein 186-like [Coccinella septempunctata]